MADACEYGNEPSGSIKCRNFLTSCNPVSFSRRTLHHGVSKKVSMFSVKYVLKLAEEMRIKHYQLHMWRNEL